jgi:hypothetical protein
LESIGSSLAVLFLAALIALSVALPAAFAILIALLTALAGLLLLLAWFRIAALLLSRAVLVLALILIVH